MISSLKHFASRNLPFDMLQEMDRNNECPESIVRDMYNPEILGINHLLIPKEFGGLGGSSGDIYRMCEALGRIDLGVATTVFATFLGSEPIMVGGTPEQKRKWMDKICSDGLIVAYGATEADAGSDLLNLTTRAEHVYENDIFKGYRITGNKQWISNGGIADIYTILALAPNGPSWFIVERNTPGFSPNKHEDKHGIRLSNTSGLSLDEVFVPAENLLGGVEGQGFRQAQAVFGYTRLMVGAMALGAGSEAIETAVKYAQRRIQAGGPLSEKQGYMIKLILSHAVKMEAARAYIEETAVKLDENSGELQTEGAIAKYYATEAGNAAAEDAIQALGGYGYTKDFSPEKIKRDIKITCIYEGTSEIMEITIFRARWQALLKTKWKFYSEMASEMNQIHIQNQELGADSMALCFDGVSKILAACKAQKLTRSQHAVFKLGEIIAYAETAAALVRAASKKTPFKGVPYDIDTYRAISRVCSRESAFYVISEALKLIAGASSVDAMALAEESGMTAILGKQRNITEDMDIIGKKLCEINHI